MHISKFLVLAGGHIRCLRCTAQSKRTKLQCARPALKASMTQKCQFHGGRGSGPKTTEGKARIGAAHLKHGNDTNKNRQERSESSLRLAQLEDVAHAIGLITSATRTTGRKPLGYRAIRTLDEAKAWVVEDALHRINGGKERG